MKILVTGGRGQLGLSLEKVAGEYPQHNFIFTDLPQPDITDAVAMRTFIGRCGADAIVNCAAYTAVDMAESEPEAAGRVNTSGPAVLAGLAKEAGIPLVHISTDYVFDGRACRPYREDDPTGPTGVYGRTKLAGENAVKESGADAVVVRTSWLYSEFGNNFCKTMLRLAETRDTVAVVDDQVGTPTYAPDLARAVILILENGVGGYRLYHFSNEGTATWADFAEEIFRMAGKQVAVRRIATADYPTAAERPAYSVLDKSRIKAAGIAVPWWQDSLCVCIEELKK